MSPEPDMSLFRAIQERRAIRCYEPVDIDAETIHTLLKASPR